MIITQIASLERKKMIEFHKKLWRQIVEHKTITIYCLIEEFLKVISNKKEHKLSKISNVEVLFIDI